jgi:AcrR family transcriptional regulator
MSTGTEQARESGERTLRCDAARNRERVLAAAADAFAEHGLEASIAEVARRAGVGKATIFRSYPTKADLIGAVMSEPVRWVAGAATDALAEPDAWAAFAGLMAQIAERHATDLPHAAALGSASGSRELDEARARAREALDALMDRAKAQGAMRSDATAEDVGVLFKGVTAAMPAEQRHDVERWRRWAAMFTAALRAEPA